MSTITLDKLLANTLSVHDGDSGMSSSVNILKPQKEQPLDTFLNLCNPPKNERRASFRVLSGYDAKARASFQSQLLMRCESDNTVLVDGSEFSSTGPLGSSSKITLETAINKAKESIISFVLNKKNCIIYNAETVLKEQYLQSWLEIVEEIPPIDKKYLNFVSNYRECLNNNYFLEENRQKRFHFILVEQANWFLPDVHNKIMELIEIVFSGSTQEERADFDARLKDLLVQKYYSNIESHFIESKKIVTDQKQRVLLSEQDLKDIKDHSGKNRWSDRKIRRISPFHFVQTTFAKWLGKGLTQAHLKIDPELYQALRSWRMRHGQPADVDLPAREFKHIEEELLEQAGLLGRGIPSRLLLAAAQRAARYENKL